MRGAEDPAQPVVLAEEVLEIGEAVILRGVVVEGVRPAIRRFDAEIVAQEVSRHEVVEVTYRATVEEARLDVAMASAIERQVAVLVEDPALGRDVDDAGGAQSVFGGQRSGDQ